MESITNERNIFGDKNINFSKYKAARNKCKLVNKKMLVYFKIKILDILFGTPIAFLIGHIFYYIYY